MAAINSIGPFTFISLRGTARPPQQQLIVLSRPGVPGNAVWRTGRRGIPFQLIGIVDSANITTAHALFYKYSLFVGGNPLTLVKDSVWMDLMEGYRVLVEDVEALRIHATLASSGGLTLNSRAKVVSRWQLRAIAI